MRVIRIVEDINTEHVKMVLNVLKPQRILWQIDCVISEDDYQAVLMLCVCEIACQGKIHRNINVNNLQRLNYVSLLADCFNILRGIFLWEWFVSTDLTNKKVYYKMS